MATERFDIQGRWLGIPYDWRIPGWAKVRARWWCPAGPMLVPKVFGWGWDLNLAHPGSWALLVLIALVAAAGAAAA